MSRPPTGEQFELEAAGQRLVAVELGGGLRAYSAGSREVLDGYGVEQRPDGARGQILAPWPNRLRDGRYEWGGASLQLPLNEPEHANAIHGLVRGERWSLVERAAGHMTLGCRLAPSAGYPFTLDLRVGYALGVGGLTVELIAENAGEQPAPYGVGFHPYLAVGGVVDDAVLEIPAERVLVADERAIPVSEVAVEGTDFDFRAGREIGPLELDTCFTGLSRRVDGRARIVVRGVTLWLDGAFGYVMIYSGDTLSATARRRRGLAVEPMTCPPNAFATREHVVSLAPGTRHVARWGIEP